MTITPSTKVTLGVLLLVLSAVGGAALFITKLDTNVATLVKLTERMVDAVDRNTAQLVNNGTTLAVHGVRLDAIEDK